MLDYELFWLGIFRENIEEYSQGRVFTEPLAWIFESKLNGVVADFLEWSI